MHTTAIFCPHTLHQNRADSLSCIQLQQSNKDKLAK